MIMQRVIYETKTGRQREAIELLKNAPLPECWPDSSVYSSGTGALVSPRGNVVIMELQLENLAELEVVWAAWKRVPGSGAWHEKFSDCLACRSSEIWQVEQ